MKKNIILILLIIVISIIATACKNSAQNIEFEQALRTMNLEEIKNAATKTENLNKVYIGSNVINPILYLWNIAPSDVFIETLLQYGANADYKNGEGQTLLMYATGLNSRTYGFYQPQKDRSSIDYAALFLVYGADVNARDKITRE